MIKRALVELNFKPLINIWDIFLSIEIDKTHYDTVRLEKKCTKEVNFKDLCNDFSISVISQP